MPSASQDADRRGLSEGFLSRSHDAEACFVDATPGGGAEVLAGVPVQQVQLPAHACTVLADIEAPPPTQPPSHSTSPGSAGSPASAGASSGGPSPGGSSRSGDTPRDAAARGGRGERRGAARAGSSDAAGPQNRRVASASPRDRRAPRHLGAEGLPDLTEQLKEYGIYGEYAEFRQRYQQWRLGHARGAAGELTSRSLLEGQAADRSQFEYWYPTASVFQWRFTTAYWTAVLFLLGALLMTFSSCLCFVDVHDAGLLEQWPNLFGSLAFAVGAYCSYLQLINITTKAEEHAWVWADWREIKAQVGCASLVGTVAYLAGALIFVLGPITELLPAVKEVATFWLIHMPNIAGSVGFVVGGICELLHNRMFCRGGATMREAVWWASASNTFGGILFLVGSVLGPAATTWDAESKKEVIGACFSVGAFCFVVSSIFMIVMWKANDFGLTLLKQLNFAIRSRATVSLAATSGQAADQQQVRLRVRMPTDMQANRGSKPKFSTRGAIFMVVYCWFAFVALVNMIIQELRYEHAANQTLMFLWHATNMVTQIFIVAITALVLIIHSVVTHVPDEQPYRFALIAGRCVFLMGAVAQTAQVLDFFWRPLYGY